MTDLRHPKRAFVVKSFASTSCELYVLPSNVFERADVQTLRAALRR